MSSSGGNERVQVFLYHCGELRPRWSQVDAIGLDGRCSGAVLCAEFTSVGGAVGGETVWAGWPRVQFRRICNQASLGRYDRLGNKVRVAWHRGLVVVHGWVRLGTGACVGAWEH
jgi:hypothetical protein